ncbi:MAG TPA: GNAT family N-acetyltransferase [Pseudolabrys sp.]
MTAKDRVVSGEAAEWRSTTAADLDAIQKIANVVHPKLAESNEVFAEKLRLFPEGCFVLVEDGVVLGYAFVHPWRLNDVPKLNDFLRRIPSESDCLLIHDVAVLHRARGRGASKALLDLMANLARDREIPSLALVSVYNSRPHWGRLGFEVVSNELIVAKLKSYGDTASYMVRALANGARRRCQT